MGSLRNHGGVPLTQVASGGVAEKSRSPRATFIGFVTQGRGVAAKMKKVVNAGLTLMGLSARPNGLIA
jgi:hypothetical protein